MKELAELALVVCLGERDLEAELRGEALDANLELHQGDGGVVLRVPPPQHVEVDAVQHLHAVLHPACTSATAARRSESATSCPGVTRPGASTSTNGTSPPRRFLSRAKSWTTRSGSVPSKASGSPCAASSSATSRLSASRP